MRRNIAIAILLIVFLLPGCNGQGTWVLPPQPGETPGHGTPPTGEQPPDPTGSAVLDPTETPSPTPVPTPDPVEAQLAAMTTQEKVGQLLVAGIEGVQAGEDARMAVEDYRVGGVILFGRNVASAPQLAGLNNALKALSGDGIPLFLCVDEEGGRVSRMPPEVAGLPSPYQFVQDGGDPAALGGALAEACGAFGFQVDFAPSADVWSNPSNTVIGDRAFGSEWTAVADRAVQAMEALRAGGIIPVVKHFPGHGDTAVDSHQALPVVEKPLARLKQEELIPFQAAIGAGAPAVMVAHIQVAQVDPQFPASLSPAVVCGLLRQEMGFDGVVFTDDLTMGAISNTYGMGEAAVLAVEAGCDVLLVCHGADNLVQAYTALLEAVDSGRISTQRLDESVRRILCLKAAYGVDSVPVPEPDVETLNQAIRSVLPK